MFSHYDQVSGYQLEKTFLILIALFSATSSSAQIIQWVDDSGRIHYGDRAPEQYKNRSKIVKNNGENPTEVQIEEARARLQKNREALRKNSVDSPSIEKQPTNSTQPSQAPPEKELSCEEQWRKYDEAWACLNPYRIKGGVIKGGEGLDKCPLVKQPEICKN
jgi:hypothetical protein